MLSDVMAHFGLRRSLRQVGYFATAHHQQILKDSTSPPVRGA
jgi:hypothetical protein